MVRHYFYSKSLLYFLRRLILVYGRSVEHDVKKHLNGDFENVLLEMLWRDRGANKGCDVNKAHDMAAALNNGILNQGFSTSKTSRTPPE